MTEEREVNYKTPNDLCYSYGFRIITSSNLKLTVYFECIRKQGSY
jgi:hypothetical protein